MVIICRFGKGDYYEKIFSNNNYYVFRIISLELLIKNEKNKKQY
tara:strand:+ start:1047 stop:1178 length:132 start_codon:yes stop_codon:yes gene_type:complete